MKTKIILMLMVLGMASCSEDALKEMGEVTVEDFAATVYSGAKAGDVIGTIQASTTLGELTFDIKSESISGAIALDETSGVLSVGDPSVFDFEINPSITGVVTVINGEVSEEVNLTITVSGVTSEDLVVIVDENPANDFVLGQLVSKANGSTASFTFSAQEPAGALAINAAGEVSVKDKSLFDYEARTEVTATVKVSVGEVFSESEITITLRDVAPSWQVIGAAGFSAGKAHDQSIAVHNGIPYVAYRDEANGNKTTVMKYEDDQWQVVGTAGFSQGYATFQSLAFNGDVPYVAYRDDVNNRKTTVMKYESGSWQVVGTKGFARTISARATAVSFTSESQSLVFDNGVPYIAFKDWSRSEKASVMKFDGTNWVQVGTAGFTAGATDYVTLKFASGVPYIAFEDGANASKATVMKFVNGAWEIVGTAGISSGSTTYVHLLFDGTVPYIAYSDNDEAGKTTVMKYDNSAWSVVGTAGFTQADGQYQTLGILDDKIVVAMRDSNKGGKATLMQYSGSVWSAVGTAGFSNGNVNHLDLVVDNDIPYVVYRDDAENINKTTVMRYDDK
ncbi:hypothetical protein N7E81_02455 [Reichenbachiella carrageenanivorans]|uniref:Cadherin domain-containing protein n=1 Tax=Reichenbachiella carrageenanivorans TaxID=2979869 RepID=A0ABY6D1B4_9BACT|nr:hypothetical protein [Reichenbachiella carrageenanivorans]UXX79966.1 hypothetical protein N7E81_02455 [Reichenbachiella carrageenanivorans]